MAPVTLVLFPLWKKKSVSKWHSDPALLFCSTWLHLYIWDNLREEYRALKSSYFMCFVYFQNDKLLKKNVLWCVCMWEREREKRREYTTYEYMPVIWPFQPFCCFPGVSHPFPKRPCGECPSWGILLGYETPGVDAGQGGLALRQYWRGALPGMGMPEACHTPAENLPGN